MSGIHFRDKYTGPFVQGTMLVIQKWIEVV